MGNAQSKLACLVICSKYAFDRVFVLPLLGAHSWCIRGSEDCIKIESPRYLMPFGRVDGALLLECVHHDLFQIVDIFQTPLLLI
jgi:hypothetical protein